MRGLKPSWGISVLGETPTLFAGGLESPEHETRNGQMRAESRPFCKLVTSTWVGFCGPGLFSSHSPEQSTGQAHSACPERIDSAEPRPASRTITASPNGALSACHCGRCPTGSPRECLQPFMRTPEIVLNYATGLRAEHPNILPFEGHNLVMVLFAHL